MVLPSYYRGRIEVFVWLYERNEPLTRQQLKRWDVANAFWENHSRRSRRTPVRKDP